MMKIYPDEQKILLTRGDAGVIPVSIEIDGSLYTFEVGDVVRLNVYDRQDPENVVITKDAVCETPSTTLDIVLEGVDSIGGEMIVKPTVYYWEVTLNPETVPQTFIGWDEEGPKEFILYPEAREEK